MLQKTGVENNKIKLSYIHVVLTVNCVLRCKMCFNWKNNEQNEIEGEHIKATIIALYENNLLVNDMVTINFGGAEALLRKDTFDLIKVAAERNLSTALCTSGYLYNAEVSKKIVDSGLKCIALPLDSSDAKKHNYLRGVDGVYEKAMQIIQEHPGKVALTCTISEYNIDEICKIAEWVESNDNVAHLGFQAIVSPLGVNWEGAPRREWIKRSDFGHLWPKDMKKVNSNMDKLIKIRNNSKKIYTTEKHLNFFKSYFEDPFKICRNARCRIGDNALTIMNKGDVVFCHDNEPLGNIRAEGIIDILSGPKVAQAKRKMLDCTQVCEFYVNCFFEE